MRILLRTLALAPLHVVAMAVMVVFTVNSVGRASVWAGALAGIVASPVAWALVRRKADRPTRWPLRSMVAWSAWAGVATLVAWPISEWTTPSSWWAWLLASLGTASIASLVVGVVATAGICPIRLRNALRRSMTVGHLVAGMAAAIGFRAGQGMWGLVIGGIATSVALAVAPEIADRVRPPRTSVGS